MFISLKLFMFVRMTQNNGVTQVYSLLDNLNKTWFRRGTFHEPNLIQIKVDPKYSERLN